MGDAFGSFSRVDEILAEALRQPAEKRRSWLADACDDDELRIEVERLLTGVDGPELLLSDDEGRHQEWLGRCIGRAVDDDGGDGLAAGLRLGDYEIREKVGAGGMGDVYRARDLVLERDVALKVLPASFAADDERLARFRREAKLLASLNHSNVAVIHRFVEHETVRFLVLELVPGETLARVLDRQRLPVERALDVAQQIAEGLVAAHQAGVIHRDLKPSNVMMTPDGRIKILDFGVAKAAPAPRVEGPTASTLRRSLTEAQAVIGTPAYMSPESWRGAAVDHRSDVWAFGCLLYELLTGSQAFQGASSADVSAAVLTRAPDWTSLKGNVPERIVELIQRCLTKAPDARIGSMSAVLAELRATSAVAPSVESKPDAPTNVDRRRLLGLAATLAGVVGLVGGLVLWNREPSRAIDDAPIDSIAVLPFDNASGDPESSYLSDGISESLTNSLSKLPGLRVVPRGVAFAYKGRTNDPTLVAQELDVRALVTGRVSERDGQLVVTAELIDAVQISQLWGEQYRRPMTALLDVQEDLVRQIADALRVELTPESERRALHPATENAEAYRLYLKTNYHTMRLTPDDLDKALEYAEQAIELDPGFALAWVSLSQAHMTRAYFGMESWTEAGAISRTASERALEIDDTLAAAWIEYGFVKHHFDWDWQAAERAFARGVELDPTHSDALQGHSESLLSLGRLDEALAEAQRAVDANPVSAQAYAWLGFCLRVLRRPDDALASYDRALEIEPGHLLASPGRPRALLDAKRFDEAITELETRLRSWNTDLRTSTRLASFYAVSGRDAAARDIVRRLDVATLSEGDLANLARTFGALGETDRAFEIIEGLLAERSRALHFANVAPHWDVLRGDPRFDRVLARMGLPKP